MLELLRQILGDRVSTSDSVREHHSHGESFHAPGVPDVVVFPVSTDDVSRIVSAAARHGAAIVPFGAGSSLEGHVNAVAGGGSFLTLPTLLWAGISPVSANATSTFAMWPIRTARRRRRTC